MRNTFFADIKKLLPTSMTEARLEETENKLGTGISTEIQHLAIEEYMAIAGGPQVENDPQL